MLPELRPLLRTRSARRVRTSPARPDRVPSCARALALLVPLSVTGCDGRQPVDGGGAAALARNLARARVVEVHVEDESAVEPLRRLAARERARTGRDVRVLVRDPGDPDAVRIVVGTPRSGVASTLAVRAGVDFFGHEPTGFRVGDLAHESIEDAVRATLEDPERPGLPVTVWIGNDLALLVPQIEDLAPRARPWITTWRLGDPALTGPLAPRGGLVAGETLRVGVARLALRGSGGSTVEAEGLKVEVAGGIAPQAASAAIAAAVRARQNALAWADAPAEPVDLRLLAAVEDLRLGGEGSSLGRWNRSRPAAEMLVAGGVTDGGAAVARASLRSALGPAVVPWLEEGASISASGSWWGRAMEAWLARLSLAEALPSAAQCVDTRWDGVISPHVLGPVRSALFDYLLVSRGADHVRAVWNGTAALDVDPEFEENFAAILRLRAGDRAQDVEEDAARRHDELSNAPPSGGIGLVETGPDPRVGYGSRRSLQALEQIRKRGAHGVAITAAFLDASGPDGPMPAWAPLGPVEGDVALFATSTAAHQLGLSVALQPSLLASASGSYAGSWTRTGEAEWAAFFERQARAIQHAGLLANLAGADWLTVSSGLRAVSSETDDGRRAKPGEAAWKQEGWRRVIGAARGAFAGLLTYGAIDVEEARKCGFWQELDAIGYELHPRVEAGSPNPRYEIEQRMRLALGALAELSEQHRRPIVLTSTSFAPFLEGASTAVGRGEWTVAQLVILTAALESGPCAVQGVWLWRASTDPSDAGFNSRDPLLSSQPVESALGPFFQSAPRWFTGAASPGAGGSPR